MVPLGDEAQVEARFGLSDIVLILTQDRCTVCVECTIGSEIVLDAPVGTPRCCGSCGISLLSIWRQCYCRCKIDTWFALDGGSTRSSFWPFGHGANLDARKVHGLRQT